MAIALLARYVPSIAPAAMHPMMIAIGINRLYARCHFIYYYAERHGSADPTLCGGYAGPDCWCLSFLFAVDNFRSMRDADDSAGFVLSSTEYMPVVNAGTDDHAIPIGHGVDIFMDTTANVYIGFVENGGDVIHS